MALGLEIYAIPLSGHSAVPRQLLSIEEQRRLALIASIHHFEAGKTVFRSGDPATEIFNIISGVAKTVATLADGRQSTIAFFFNHDLLGMFEAGRYSHTAEAVTPVTTYSLPIGPLERLLRNDPNLQLHFLCKVLHELRTAQRQAIALGRFGAVQKIALFLDFLDRHPEMHKGGDGAVMIPMDRADIADYVGLTVESVSRTLQKLHRSGVIGLDGRHIFKIRDRAALDRLIGDAITADTVKLRPSGGSDQS